MIFFILFSNIPYIYLLTRYHAANGIIFSFSLVNICLLYTSTLIKFLISFNRSVFMYVKEVSVKNQVGLHARPATFFIQKADVYKRQVYSQFFRFDPVGIGHNPI